MTPLKPRGNPKPKDRASPRQVRFTPESGHSPQREQMSAMGHKRTSFCREQERDVEPRAPVRPARRPDRVEPRAGLQLHPLAPDIVDVRHHEIDRDRPLFGDPVVG